MGCECSYQLSKQDGEHPKSKSTGGFYRPDRSPRTTMSFEIYFQGWAKIVCSPGFVNFVPAFAHHTHFCLKLPEKFFQPGGHFLAPPCTQEAWNEKVLALCFKDF